MTATTTTYRKTKTGEWVVFGPERLVRVGQVLVTKRDGASKTETIERVGKSFDCDGMRARYGYIAARQHRHVPARERCLHCGGNGSVERELGACGACGADFDL